MGRDIFFSDEFMDDLAERVARKLATRFYRNGFFAEKEPKRRKSIIYTEDDEDINYGCGSANHRRYESSGGCGSGSSYQPNGGC